MKIVRIVAVVITLLVAVPLAIAHAVLAASLPKLDGAVDAPSLAAPVSIARDALGIPTITATTRVDLAYGTGFAHAQDRFFQMDLSRRLSAGELSELFGRAALAQDEKARIFRFRHVAEAVLAQAPPQQRAILEAYARGVNAGLASLRSRPWEYWLLRSRPAPWRPEDTALVSYAMWWDLQYSSIRSEMVKRAINARLDGAECANGWKCALAFFYPHGTIWDSPNAASEVSAVAPIRIPSVEELNVRGSGDSTSNAPPSPERAAPVGSNGWAVAGTFTSSGSALVASDMHLNLRVPAVWYRARLRLAAVAGSAAESQPAAGTSNGAAAMDVSGLTLPGAPVLVAGSNGHIAWGFTNSYGDWSDVTLAPCEGSAQSAVAEIIHVKGESDVRFTVKSSPAGVLFDSSPAHGGCWFVRWLATVPAATNFNLLALEKAESTAQALAVAPSIGIPHQNFMVGDRDGHIAWSILGRIPDALGDARLSGQAPWTTEQTQPRLLDPSTGRVWTANARAIDDPTYEAVIGGDEAGYGADYDLGARAHQIRDDLFAIKSGATPADMMRIQLDDRALFLARWHDLLLGLLDEPALQGHPQRAQLRRIIADWRSRASADSVGYRLVRAWRSHTERAAWEMIVHALDIDASEAPPPAQFEGALWQMVSTQPSHLLAASFQSWRDFLLTQVDATLAQLAGECPQLDRCTWGSRNPVRVRHPLSRALPFASAFLDMPTVELSGDHDMPRVQDGAFGASERFAVSPGHETQGYLQIAGGESGHPLSAYYRAGFREWAAGTPLPFLPGIPEHELTLDPAR